MPSDSNEKPGESLNPTEKQVKGFSRQFAMAMELPFIIFAAAAVGGLLGYYLDGWLRTKPILMLILGFLGFFAGVRDVLRRLPSQDNDHSNR
jgi:F0F1-type ATP synthase assembly protein I